MDPLRFLAHHAFSARCAHAQPKAVTAVEDLGPHGREQPSRAGAHLRQHRSYERLLRRYGNAEEHIDDRRGDGRTEERRR
jgi:hypothetical protein